VFLRKLRNVSTHKKIEKPPSYDTAAAKQPEDGDKYQRFE